MIECNDILIWAKEYEGEKFHALLTDPPYHMTSITKRFGKVNSAPAKYGKDGAFARASKGFMGQTWDGGDIAFQSETWSLLGNHLHPGAFGMAFASARGWHRLAVAIEDAGFIIHPSIFGWLYGSGFPKAHRIDTQLNSAMPIAKVWEGHRYGLQALKPALEPIIVFQKPYEGRPVSNILKTGAGTLNIEGSRIGTRKVVTNRWVDNMHPFGEGAGNEYRALYNIGLWPANFVLENEGAIEALRKQKEDAPEFFFSIKDRLDEAEQVFYSAKANIKEKGGCGHPTVKPIKLTTHLAKLLLPPEEYAPRRLLVPFSGVASEVIGAYLAGWDYVLGVEIGKEYCEIAEKRLDKFLER